MAEVLAKVATLAWTIAAARMLTLGDFGSLTYAISVVLLASAIPTWGLDSVLMRRGSADPSQLPRLHSEVLAWKSVLALPTFAIVALMASVTRPTSEATIVFILVVVSAFPELWSTTARASAAAWQRPAGVSVALVLQRLATAVAVMVALVAGTGVIGVAAAYLVGTIIGWIGHVRAVSHLDLHFGWRSLRRDGLRRMLSGTMIVGLSAVVLVVLFRVDTVILAALDGDEAVATYAVAYRLMETVLFVSWAINQSIFPVMSAKASTQRITRAYEQGLALVGFVYLPFATVCFLEGSRIIGLLFGGIYATRSAPILWWLAPTPLLFAAALFGTSVLMSRGRAGGMLGGALAATVVNVALNFTLIPAYSGLGAAVATTSSYAVYVVIVQIALRRSGVFVRLLRPLAEVVVSSCALAAALLILDLALLAELAVGGVFYLGTWLFLARWFAPDQVDVAKRLLSRGDRS
ncbi:MAG: flippase [Actinomycetota bacterium]|nr:flippase [Actinomycetota bacterium]